jgi:hypothetical protein
MGPCGFSTRQGRWRYDFDLAGPGPVYRAAAISIHSDSDREPITVRAGTIQIDPKRRQATIQLETAGRGRPAPFIGNGTYRIHSLR